MSVIRTQKASFFPATHADILVFYPCIEEGEGVKGILEEVSRRYATAYLEWRNKAESGTVKIGDVIVDRTSSNGQTLIFLPLKNNYRDGIVNEHVILAMKNLAQYLEKTIRDTPQHRTVSMAPILLYTADGETRRNAAIRTVQWMAQYLGYLHTTIEVSVSPWRMQRREEDSPLFWLPPMDSLPPDWKPPTNHLGSMERYFVTTDPRWLQYNDHHVEPSSVQVYKSFGERDDAFVKSLCS